MKKIHCLIAQDSDDDASLFTIDSSDEFQNTDSDEDQINDKDDAPKTYGWNEAKKTQSASWFDEVNLRTVYKMAHSH